jgi:hypothetical protein
VDFPGKLTGKRKENGRSTERSHLMPAKRRKRRYAKKTLTEKQRLAEARKALMKTQRVLEAELEKVEGYVKALDWHIPFFA